MNYFLLQLGCATNKSDAERIASVLDSAGYAPVASAEEADLVGIVACSIRQSAIDRVYDRIHKWNLQKKKRPLTTFVSGCILEEDKKKFLKLFDIVLPLNDVTQLPEYLRQQGTSAGTAFWDIKPHHSSLFKALVPIQNGCNNFCTYCAVPYTRGREESRPSKDILQEVQTLLNNGYKQITLLGQNVNSYGQDTDGQEISFAALLDLIGTMADSARQHTWVYYTSPHPADMTQDVLKIQSKHRSLANYLNLPLQSGSDDVLNRMNRRYTAEEYFLILEDAHSILPDLTVSTDFIVGFSGETDNEFQYSVDALQRGAFDMAFIAQYSERPGALAEKRFPDDIAKAVKKERERTLTSVLTMTAAAANEKLVGQTIPALVETTSRKPGRLLARTEGLKSVEFISDDKKLIGEYVNLRVDSCDAWRLYGMLAG
ncbi:MAG: MiaB/RimO family radical SAM methylthiotransferase [Candidatus Kerfeldbacteria bacterium]